MLKKIVISALVLLLFMNGYLIYSGLLFRVKFEEKVAGPYIVVYQNHTGPYTETGKVMDEIYTNLKKQNIQTMQGFGLYYDNPKTISPSLLRSDVGCVIDESARDQLLRAKTPYKMRDLSAKRSIVAEFPFKSKLSIFIGVLKVYPALNTYLQASKYTPGPVMEIYDMEKQKIYYISPIE